MTVKPSLNSTFFVPSTIYFNAWLSNLRNSQEGRYSTCVQSRERPCFRISFFPFRPTRRSLGRFSCWSSLHVSGATSIVRAWLNKSAKVLMFRTLAWPRCTKVLQFPGLRELLFSNFSTAPLWSPLSATATPRLKSADGNSWCSCMNCNDSNHKQTHVTTVGTVRKCWYR